METKSFWHLLSQFFMIYDFMRLIVFFDLPVVTKTDRHAYSVFRKYLIKQGYLMMQYSVYCKLFNNQDAVENHLKMLKKNIPKDGSIRAMMVTEKQYSKILILLGARSVKEEASNLDAVIKL